MIPHIGFDNRPPPPKLNSETEFFGIKTYLHSFLMIEYLLGVQSLLYIEVSRKEKYIQWWKSSYRGIRALVPNHPMSSPSLISFRASLIELAVAKLFQVIEVSIFSSSSTIFRFVVASIHLNGAVLNKLLFLEFLESQILIFSKFSNFMNFGQMSWTKNFLEHPIWAPKIFKSNFYECWSKILNFYVSWPKILNVKFRIFANILLYQHIFFNNITTI